MKINENKIIKKLIEEANRNMKPGYSIGRLLSVEEVQRLCPYGLDGAWVGLQRGELSEGNNNLLYEINGEKNLYAMAELKIFGEECSGVMLYGTIEDLFEGFCGELATIPFGKNN